MINKPKITLLHQDAEIKVLKLVGIAGDTLPDHEINIPAILSVRSGEITYIESDVSLRLHKGQFKLIPSNVVHNLLFRTDTRLELITFAKSKMRFTPE